MGRLEAALSSVAGRLSPCPVASCANDLAAADRASLDAALADPGVPAIAVAVALSDLGVLLAASDVRNHRAGDCPCVLKGA